MNFLLFLLVIFCFLCNLHIHPTLASKEFARRNWRNWQSILQDEWSSKGFPSSVDSFLNLKWPHRQEANSNVGNKKHHNLHQTINIASRISRLSSEIPPLSSYLLSYSGNSIMDRKAMNILG